MFDGIFFLATGTGRPSVFSVKSIERFYRVESARKQIADRNDDRNRDTDTRAATSRKQRKARSRIFERSEWLGSIAGEAV